MQIHWSLTGVGMTVLKMFIRMRKVEIGEKLKKLLNQRLRIHAHHLKYFFHFLRPGDRFFGGQGSGNLEGFDGFCEFRQFLSNLLRNWELGASPDGILGSFIKQNEEIRSRPSLGESPKPWIFFIFIENPLKINDFNDFNDIPPLFLDRGRFRSQWLVLGSRCLKW